MDPKHYLFVDERLLGRCVYCGGKPDTRDHVPPRILLDDPLPANLPIVEACVNCNRSFSLDEEYLACFLECVLVGSSDAQLVRRPKVKRSLLHNQRLAERIQSTARLDENGQCVWTPERDRVRSVLVKLARGHVAYELSLTQIDEPQEIVFLPLSAMSEAAREVFERAGAGAIRGWPEVSSRAFLRACGAEPYSHQQGPWIVVQPGQYRYTVDQHGGVRVQMVIADYLACSVDWEWFPRWMPYSFASFLREYDMNEIGLSRISFCNLNRCFVSALIVSVNPSWRDLGEEWYERHQYQPQSA